MKTFKEWVEELSGETLVEASKTKIRADSIRATPNLHSFPHMDYYTLYRMGVAMASMPDEMKTEEFGPAGARPLTIGYTDEEHRMIELAHKLMGQKKVELTNPGSRELEDVQSTSPVSNWNKKK